MSESHRAAAYSARAPLGDATQRVNNTTIPLLTKPYKPRGTNGTATRPGVNPRRNPNTAAVHGNGPVSEARGSALPLPVAQNTRHPAVSRAKEAEAAKRNSQASHSTATSSNRSSGIPYKTHVGPWQLGKTLGKGSSARVRLCRHRLSGELAAVKIVPKKTAYLIQAGSLAALHAHDDKLPERINGEMRVPLAIEREVAILKLIEHPNVMKVYDIWENRSEIYLVLEYVDQGDLFEYINRHGSLDENKAMHFFRQIMSAMSYCHDFNICHRDLKPENILLTAQDKIKVADFGMAALHQTAAHRLKTACGSPHYAAPELLKNKQYRGDKADIWSMGVILYALLTARLPFDDPDVRALLAKTKKGQYQMPEFLSFEAKDLIRRMLQVDPDTRISLQEMWHHPLVRKYNDMDDLGSNGGQPDDVRKDFHYKALQQQEVDPNLVRQLRSLWHMFSEQQLKQKLMDSEKNDQKLFYWLLQDYRQKQLENFLPELFQSPSDYHHLQQPIWKKRISTCEFNQPRSKGTGRSISRFTVISHVAETEDGTTKSYDPYHASRVFRGNSQVSHAKIVVHRNEQAGQGEGDMYVRQLSRLRTGSTQRHCRVNSQRASTTARFNSPRNSMSSLHSSRQGTPYARPASRHKRGIDFSHVKGKSIEQRGGRPQSRTGSISVPADGTTNPRDFATTSAPRNQKPMREYGPLKLKAVKRQDPTLLLNEEVRHFSHSIAKDCDEAFNSSMIDEDASEQLFNDGAARKRDSTPLSFGMGTPSILTPSPMALSSVHPWDTRPLPPLPPEKTPGPEGTIQLNPKDEQPGRVGQIAKQVNRLALPVLLPRHERRTVSAPVHTQYTRNQAPLPAINEATRDVDSSIQYAGYDKSRIVSAPPQTPRAQRQKAGPDSISELGETIRVVNSPTVTSPVPKPLNVRKKKYDQGGPDYQADLRHAYMHGAAGAAGSMTASTGTEDSGAAKKKKLSWFRRSSREDANKESHLSTENSRETRGYKRRSDGLSEAAGHYSTESTSTLGIPVPAKKKSFGFLFWKTNKPDPMMTIAHGPEYEDSPSPEPARVVQHKGSRQSQKSWHESDSGIRNIEVHQNWLARLFGVKPATSYLCLVTSRKRARQEIAIILKDWRRYGMRDIQVDKERNMVFARVGTKNYLNIKEVSFAAEIMTVIEHGKKGPLSIVRFTQERGAASSFHRVVDTLKTVFGSRNLLVTDKRKSKMMIKTLNT